MCLCVTERVTYKVCVSSSWSSHCAWTEILLFRNALPKKSDGTRCFDEWVTADSGAALTDSSLFGRFRFTQESSTSLVILLHPVELFWILNFPLRLSCCTSPSLDLLAKSRQFYNAGVCLSVPPIFLALTLQQYHNNYLQHVISWMKMNN